MLALIIWGVYATNKSPSLGTTSPTALPSTVAPAATTITPPKSAWRTSSSTDEMTGEASAYAISTTAFPTRKMDFPYSDVSSRIGIGCNSKTEWAYFIFNHSPNLSDDKTKDGYNLIKTRIKWDDSIKDASLTQKWGDKALHLKNEN